MMNRRNFIVSSAFTAAAVAGGVAFPGCSSGKKLPSFGFISGIVSNFLKEDWKGTLEKIAAQGYTEMEGGWDLGPTPQEMTDFCKSIGISPFAGGTGLVQLLESLEVQIEKALECRNEYLVCYWPWLDGADNITADQCKVSAEQLNKIGETCQKAGLKFCWHNHDREFLRDTGEGLPFDLLMKWTDPQLVRVELDLYWAQKGGADPLQVLQKYPGRYAILHVKDMDDSPEKDFACVGEGVVDFPAAFREADRQGIGHVIVEKDGETDGINCLTRAAAYLKEIRL